MPVILWKHCSVLVGDNVFLVGGHYDPISYNRHKINRDVYSIEIHNGTVTKKAQTYYYYSNPVCGSYNSGNKAFIIVQGLRFTQAGGTYPQPGGGLVPIVESPHEGSEIYDVAANNWTIGKYNSDTVTIQLEYIS